MGITNQTSTWWSRLLSAEPVIDERYRPFASAGVIVFAVAYAVSFLGLMQHVAYLGPGLGDELSFEPFTEVFDHFYQAAGGNWLAPPLLLFTLLTTANLVFTAAIITVGYWIYPRTVGKPFPLTVLFTLMLLNAICTLGIAAIHVLAAVVASLFGYDISEGLQLFSQLCDALRNMAQGVPTLLDLPAWLAGLPGSSHDRRLVPLRVPSPGA